MSASTSSQRPTLTPIFFPSGNRRLMGVHYAPVRRPERPLGILMCNQVGPDYGEYYKTGRTLVGMLAAKGFDCLRFDYTGWGDSEGAHEEASVPQWLSDVAAAHTLLRDRSGCDRVCLCGFGFGALLAAAHLASHDADALVLWESVLNGNAYCRLLRVNHQQWLRGSFVKATAADKRFQAMGFPASADLEREMGQLRLNDLAACQVKRAFAVVREGSPDRALTEEHLGRQGVRFRSCTVSPDSLPLRPMRAVVGWLEGSADND